MFKSVKPATIVKHSNDVANPLSFAKAHGGSLTMKHQGGAYCVAFRSTSIKAHGWGSSIQKAYENMLQHFEVKNEMYIRKQLLKTVFAPKSNQKTVA